AGRRRAPPDHRDSAGGAGRARLCARVGERAYRAARRHAGRPARRWSARGRERPRRRRADRESRPVSRPRLRSDLVVVEQSYRGERSYIVKDPATHKYFRFRPLEKMVMEQFAGEGTAAAGSGGLAAEWTRSTV